MVNIILRKYRVCVTCVVVLRAFSWHWSAWNFFASLLHPLCRPRSSMGSSRLKMAFGFNFSDLRLEAFVKIRNANFTAAEEPLEQKSAFYERRFAELKRQVKENSEHPQKIESLLLLFQIFSEGCLCLRVKLRIWDSRFLRHQKKLERSAIAAANDEQFSSNLRIKLQASEKNLKGYRQCCRMWGLFWLIM